MYRIEKHADSEVQLYVDGQLHLERAYAALRVLPYYPSCIRFGGGHPSIPAYADFAYVGYRIGAWSGAEPRIGTIAGAVAPEPPPAYQPTGFAPLTSREREVARLIAHGLNNRQIATRLGVARGTVERHVANIFDKLAVRSRVEVAMWAVAQREEPERSAGVERGRAGAPGLAD